MKFYDRATELRQLAEIRMRSLERSQMTFVTGRRRIGKTTLLKHAYTDHLYLYFFVAKKSEPLLCAEFLQEVVLKLKVEIYGTITKFEDLFGFLLQQAKTRNFTVIIDEFQEFYAVNSSVYSAMQNVWDQHRDESKLNLILCGSVYSLMSKIFENAKEPLFGRADHRIKLKAFAIDTLKQILVDYHPAYLPEDLLAFYTITGGVAKYVEVLSNAAAFTYQDIVSTVLSENSYFIDEGKNVLLEEFGRDYTTYFSILSLIAQSRTSRPEMESLLGMNLGGFLVRLEKDFDLIEKVKPIYSKPEGRTLKYRIKDNFLNFWFRFIFKNWSAVEIENFAFLQELVSRDYPVYSGMMLERYFRQKITEEKKYSLIGSYWEKAHQNEIDIVAENALTKTILFGEVKRNENKINLDVLKSKSLKLQMKKKGFTFMYAGFSFEEM